MTELKFDPETPFIFRHSRGDKILARFRRKADAQVFSENYQYGEVIDTTPVALPAALGTTIHSRNSMPLVRTGVDTWVMPMSGTPHNPEYARDVLAAPFRTNRVATDDDVRMYLQRLGEGSYKITEPL